jgi:hypothetical protein
MAMTPITDDRLAELIGYERHFGLEVKSALRELQARREAERTALSESQREQVAEAVKLAKQFFVYGKNSKRKSSEFVLSEVLILCADELGRVAKEQARREAERCPVCGGDGWTLEGRNRRGDLLRGDCPACHGTGKITAEPERDVRQKRVAEWCAHAFGMDHASSVPQRGIRHAEEAIESAQAAGCERKMVHNLVDYVFDRPAGKLSQEIGGSGITLLALADAAGLSADAEEARELARVLAKPLEHFAARNKAKDDAGFDTAKSADPGVPPNCRNVLFPGDPSTCQDDPCACAAEPELLTALREALPKLSHSVECLSHTPTEKWKAEGSVSFENCRCVISRVRAAISQYEQKERG